MEEGGFIVLTGMNIGRIRARRGGLLIRRQSVLLGIEFLLFSLVHLSVIKDFLLKLDDILLAIISSGEGVFSVSPNSLPGVHDEFSKAGERAAGSQIRGAGPFFTKKQSN